MYCRTQTETCEIDIDEQHLDDDDDEVDSAMGSAAVSIFSQSLRSSVLCHRYENGRRYHGFKDGAYLNPDDEAEQYRLNLHHHLYRMMLRGRLFTAPVASNPRHMLDICTGTGLWAIKMADDLPSAQVIGTDISPIQPELVPPNCQFYIDDVEEDWVYHQKFDYIHGRNLCGAISDWPRLYSQAMDNLSAGGWFELQEYASWLWSDDDSIGRSTWVVEWLREVNRGSEMFGKPLDVVHLHKQGLINAGFVNVSEDTIKIPIGGWSKEAALKEMGKVELMHVVEAVDSFTPALYTRILGYSWDQCQVVMERVKQEFKDRRNHWYVTYHFFCGQRPETCGRA